jgi:hypothetical protein
VNQLSKSDTTHILMGLIALIIWLFGAKLSLPPEAIEYAHSAVIALCGSAFGIAVATGNPKHNGYADHPTNPPATP